MSILLQTVSSIRSLITRTSDVLVHIGFEPLDTLIAILCHDHCCLVRCCGGRCIGWWWCWQCSLVWLPPNRSTPPHILHVLSNTIHWHRSMYVLYDRSRVQFVPHVDPAHFYYCCFCTRDPAFRRLVSSLMCSVSVDPSHSLSTAVLALAFCLPLFSTFQLTHCDRLAPRSDPPTSCWGPSPSPAPAEPSRRWRMVQIPTAQPHTCTVHSLISSLSLCSRLHSLLLIS